ncbi:AI-2E family transporter [Chitiniphilus eburneus]|uniref:AI-2E family transporter n=1 Tax=Chitiniphilus eburneus TaxID=2571148 RepID=A0A4U0PWM9_9NEIS|nr:AI-2E family transporter [Chitiniphilus eburneus]TJZ72956.1 AI-2E family transporter [Chitiniphilus eburneus]
MKAHDSPLEPDRSGTPPLSRPATPGPLMPGATLRRLTLMLLSAGPLSGLFTAVLLLALMGLARDMLVPVVVGLLLALLLDPVVVAVMRLVPSRAVATVAVVILVGAMFGCGVVFFGHQLVSAAERVPELAQKVAGEIGRLQHDPDNLITKVGGSLTRLERSLAPGETVQLLPPTAPVEPAVRVPPPSTSGSLLKDTAILATSSMLVVVSKLTIILLMTFLSLLEMPRLTRGFLRVLRLAQCTRPCARHLLREPLHQLRLYVSVLLVSNLIIGVLAGIGFALAGLENPVGWGVAAGLLHFVPYIGLALFGLLTFGIAYLHDGNLWLALLLSVGMLLVASLVGTLLVSWMQSRLSRVNQTSIFVSMVFWGWLWGLWGLILGPALAVMMKAVLDRMRRGKAILWMME